MFVFGQLDAKPVRGGQILLGFKTDQGVSGVEGLKGIKRFFGGPGRFPYLEKFTGIIVPPEKTFLIYLLKTIKPYLRSRHPIHNPITGFFLKLNPQWPG
jgi:hypothetical protein